MHDNLDLMLYRARRVLAERLRPAIHSTGHPLQVASFRVNGEPIPVADGLAASYRPAAVGERWGRAWDTTWFRVTGEVPDALAGRQVEVLFDLGFDPNKTGFQAEGLVYTADGQPVRSLHPRAQWIPVTADAAGGEPIEFYVEAAANPEVEMFRPTEVGDWDTAGDDLLYRLGRCDVAAFHVEVFELVHDVEVLIDLAQQLPSDSERRARILHTVDRALDLVDLQDVAGTAARARERLVEVLASPASASTHRISAVGHAHIDSAWLWPLRETVRKVARTTTSMVRLIEDHDEFVYAMSSAQQYAWLKQHRPEVFAIVRQAVAEGRFVPVGGMWVECDAVLPGGESMIRQFSYGQRFFREEFGLECTGAWLPDSFGYSAALPQLLRGAGYEWFLTQKISWNERNRFPHHTFWWEGIDGSRIFTHFPPMDTYNSELSAEELFRAARQYREKAVGSTSLAPTGYGDGGGGTTREMVARAKRLADLEGSPRVTWEAPDVFFARARAELPEPAVWRGELYLERHRGTYTSQHAMKQGNRRSESLLAEAELWSSVAAIRAGHPYPYEALDQVWRDVLLHQFHDILPGSSIAWVHRQARERYAELAATLESIIADALNTLGVTLGDGPLAINGSPVVQAGVAAGSIGPAERAPRRVIAEGDGFVLASEFTRVVVDAAGLVTSAIDQVTGRDAIPSGTHGNLLQLHQDFPHVWDAWDVDANYRRQCVDLTALDGIELDGDALVITRSFGDSRIEQRLSLDDAGRVLLIDNAIEWHEREKFLKLAFPVDVFADTAVAETQFGYQFRTTHDNTSWEDARFETHAQRWFLVQEPGFGVAFVNDSSYGFDVTRVERDGQITQDARFSLLRAPRYPDPRTDIGTQRMRVGVLVGADPGEATAAGYRVNVPARRGHGPSLPALIGVSAPGVLVSAVKLADDRSGDLVVRVYEAHGRRTTTQVDIGIQAREVHRADLLERVGEEIVPSRSGDGVAVSLALRPFEVATLRISR
ncbi:MAG: glycoside hydrolase family 38 C-terminal domain-containing protein [Micropruina sp.]|uniref:alpha-mannosidase n=1 Tax=Micropruina sp. TaxID=2737536 RepID=UPI0039E2A552